MNSSSGSLQDSFNFLFLLLLYIPFNVFFMAVAAFLFSVINKLLHLNFPTWALALGAALLVFAMMVAFLDSSSNQGSLGSSVDSTVFYTTTLIVNVLIVILVLTLTGITKLIFRNPSEIAFAFGKPQLIALAVYAVITGIFAALPLLRDGQDYLNDSQNEKKIAAIKEIIDSNNISEFIEVTDNTIDLWKIALPGEQRSLLEYLVAQDKVAMVHELIKGNKDLFTYTIAWNIKSPAMLQQLIDDGMNPNQAISELTAYNNTELVKIAVEKYHPNFTSSVSYIAENSLRHKNIDLLDYLIKNGLTKDIHQSGETMYWLVDKGNVEAVHLLIEKGFPVDTSDTRLIYRAIYTHNLPFLKFLFTYPFNVNAFNDEYTNLENAIIGNQEDIFDFLLIQKPDVKTLHYTKLNGETNALLIAEKYKRPDMLAKLNRYIAQQ